jgi:glycosyltransferase involved in cell wall biosynthesis
MNILRVIDSMDPKYGGPCQGIRNIVPVLEGFGVHNEVVCLDSPDARFFGKDSFPVYALGPAAGPWHYSRNLVPWLEQHLHRFDAVIIHGLWLYYGYATSRTVRRHRESQKSKRIKLFVMPHGMLDPYFQRAPDRKLKAIRNSLYWKLIEKDVINKADGIFFTCEAELLLAREPFRPYTPKKEVNVKYGINSPPEYTKEMKEAFLKRCPEVANKPYFLFLSRIHEKKGVDILINSYLNIAQENTPKLVIAGPGLDTAYGSKIKDIVSKSAFKDSILFPGMVAGDEKWGAFYGCEAFVLPSHQENFGIAVVEALACGRPVLISNMVNIWREIETEGGGLVAEDTADGTMQLLARWAALSGREKVAMGEGARRAFEKNFHVANVAKHFVEAVKG